MLRSQPFLKMVLEFDLASGCDGVEAVGLLILWQLDVCRVSLVNNSLTARRLLHDFVCLIPDETENKFLLFLAWRIAERTLPAQRLPLDGITCFVSCFTDLR